MTTKRMNDHSCECTTPSFRLVSFVYIFSHTFMCDVHSTYINAHVCVQSSCHAFMPYLLADHPDIHVIDFTLYVCRFSLERKPLSVYMLYTIIIMASISLLLSPHAIFARNWFLYSFRTFLSLSSQAVSPLPGVLMPPISLTLLLIFLYSLSLLISFKILFSFGLVFSSYFLSMLADLVSLLLSFFLITLLLSLVSLWGLSLFDNFKPFFLVW